MPCQKVRHRIRTNDSQTAISVKSRAARRQASPSIDIDKSLKDVKPPTDDKGGDSVWSTAHLTKSTEQQANNADSKPSTRTTTKKPLRRQQRLRHEKGMERASAVAERTENKITKSKRRSKIIKARAVSFSLNLTTRRRLFSTAKYRPADVKDSGYLGRPQ